MRIIWTVLLLPSKAEISLVELQITLHCLNSTFISLDVIAFLLLPLKILFQ